EQNSDVLKRTLEVVETKFAKILHRIKWLNMGGGLHITAENFDTELLISEINRIKEKYSLEIYLEPGEAVALDAGFLVTEVLDIVENGKKIAILDTSAECHMPDVLEMPYTPRIIGAFSDSDNEDFTLKSENSAETYAYRLAGNTCLAGDIIGDYRFENPLKVGDRLTLCDMAIYSMVKNNTFNGVKLPSIVLKKKNGECEIVKEFGYEDFKRKL
ncbi:MAG: carboxynorspermidine decarboxylase, partial [Ruminococcus sp.]|nr:carboxynorspermidine decarboxylase [Ruminococcus sp.]